MVGRSWVEEEDLGCMREVDRFRRRVGMVVVEVGLGLRLLGLVRALWKIQRSLCLCLPGSVCVAGVFTFLGSRFALIL